MKIKHQIPSTKHQTSAKFQKYGLDLFAGIWFLGFVWDLVPRFAGLGFGIYKRYGSIGKSSS
jgi:hypothetical protein